MYAIRYARLALGQTCKTCNPSVPIGTWGADSQIAVLGGFVSPTPRIYVHTGAGLGGRRRGTRLLRDQLGRAGAGSWQIADRYATAS